MKLGKRYSAHLFRGAVRCGAPAVLAFVWLTGTGYAQSTDERLGELERKVRLLTGEVEKRQFGDLFIEVGESKYGLGPAASKIYYKDQGISIGGYGEMLYQNREDQSDELDFLRAILYFGYKFTDQWVFNSEIEWEHAATGEEGSVSVEFATLDYLFHEWVNLRVGLMLLPVGLINEMHEPTVFLSARRPDVENRIIPTTWRENGVGLFGEVGPFSYRAYFVNGLEGADFSASGLRGGRQKGSKALADDFAYVGRIDYVDIPGLLVGGSIYHGDSGQDLAFDLDTTIYEAHLDWKWRGWEFRVLGTIAEVDDVAELNAFRAEEEGVDISEIDSAGEELWGWYVQLGYDLFAGLDLGAQAFTPFVRWEQFDTQSDVPAGFTESGAFDVDLLTVGVNYKPIDQLVFKAEWQRFDDDAGEDKNQVNLAMGYVF